MTIPLLICDDSNMARKQVARSLPEGWDVDITFAGNGVEGVEAIRAGKGEMVFLDLTMPDLDGHETFLEIRSILPALPVIVTSGLSGEATAIRFPPDEIAAFVRKPYEPEDLIDALRTALDG